MWLVKQAGGNVVLRLLIQPRSSANKICGQHGEDLKVSLTAPPVDGKANKAVVEFLSSVFSLPKKNITIISGHQSRKKRVMLMDIEAEEVRRNVQQHLKR